MTLSKKINFRDPRSAYSTLKRTGANGPRLFVGLGREPKTNFGSKTRSKSLLFLRTGGGGVTGRRNMG